MQNNLRLVEGRKHILTCLNLEASRRNLKENKSLLANGGHEIWKKTNTGMTHSVCVCVRVCIFILGGLQSSRQLTGAHFLPFFWGPEKARQVSQDFVERERNKNYGWVAYNTALCWCQIRTTTPTHTLNVPKNKSDKAISEIVATITYFDDVWGKLRIGNTHWRQYH